jgi:hypothetical protein
MRTGVDEKMLAVSARYGVDGRTTSLTWPSAIAGCVLAISPTARHHSAVRARPKYIFRLTPMNRDGI